MTSSTPAVISAVAPYPIRRAVMLQSWDSLTFLHWAYEPHTLRALLPPSLEPHLFEGRAWVGLTPFVLRRLRLPLGPALPWISAFPETNVRTYVIGPDGRPGVWFFTLEADRLLAVLAARALYGLPYRWASMHVQAFGDHRYVDYQSTRHPIFGRGQTHVAIRPGSSFDSGLFDNFLTGRYRLYSYRGKRLCYADIDHEPWSLQRGSVVQLEQDLIEACGLPAAKGEPVVHFSRTLPVRIGRLQSF